MTTLWQFCKEQPEQIHAILTSTRTRYRINDEAALDLFSEALITAAAYETDRGPIDNPAAFLTTTIRLVFLRRLRTPPDQQIGEDPEDPEDPEDLCHQQSFKLADYIAELPPRQQEVVCYRYYHGLSGRETAQMMGLVPSTVSEHEKKALCTLRALLLSA